MTVVDAVVTGQVAGGLGRGNDVITGDGIFCVGKRTILNPCPGVFQFGDSLANRIGNLWVSDAHLDQVALYRGDGTFLTSVGGSGSEPGQFSFPAGIAAHEDGRVAVVDSLNQRIQIFKVSVSDDGRAN